MNKIIAPITEVTIILSEEEAERYKQFQKHYDTFMLMIERGVFDQQKARIEMYFDENGTLQTIQRHDDLYRKHSTAKND